MAEDFSGENWRHVTRYLRTWADDDGNVIGWAGKPHGAVTFEDAVGGQRIYVFDATQEQIENATFVHRPGELAKLRDNATGRVIAVEQNPAEFPDVEDYVPPS